MIFFHGRIQVIHFWQECHKSNLAFMLEHYIRRHMMSVCSITDDVNLRFIHHKVSILPFIINKYLVKKYFDTILVNILLLLNLSPTDYSI